MIRLMPTFIASAALALILCSLPALAALQPGEQAPKFTAQASLNGNTFQFLLQNALTKGPVVLYFFPSAYTHGCDVEAHTFATHHQAFSDAGVTIIGVSADSLKRLQEFSADPDYCAGQFPVASDSDGAIAASYGLTLSPAKKGITDARGITINHGFIPRTTFVIRADGTIATTLSSATDGLSPKQHVTRSLAIARKLQHNDQ